MKTKVYAEGGGRKAQNRACRRGFGAFLSKAGVAQGTVEVEARGSRGDAYNAFASDAGRGLPAFLLVDAEGPVTDPSPWRHLRDSDRWRRPNGTADNQCHLMVQVMESWFLADADALESFYGRGFRKQDLPRNQEVEDISKQDVLDGLARATRGTRKGSYSKGMHGFQIIELLDPEKVRKAAPHADRFIGAMTGSAGVQ